jgi:hypothetical protein
MLDDFIQDVFNKKQQIRPAMSLVVPQWQRPEINIALTPQ